MIARCVRCRVKRDRSPVRHHRGLVRAEPGRLELQHPGVIRLLDHLRVRDGDRAGPALARGPLYMTTRWRMRAAVGMSAGLTGMENVSSRLSECVVHDGSCG